MIEDATLKEEKGGYSRTDVLSKLDAYNALLFQLDEMKLSDSAVNAELERIRSMPLRKAGGFLCFKGSGFSVSDTDKYIEDLENTIREKIML